MLVDLDANIAREILERVKSRLLAAMEVRRWSVTFSIGAVTLFDVSASGAQAVQSPTA
jgi:hypothetical protein